MQKKCFIITDDKAGTRGQAQALAAALGLEFETKTVVLKDFYRLWPPSLIKQARHIYQNEDIFSEQAPKLVIAAGRGAVPAACQFKQRGSQVIFIQDPYVDPKMFDCVIAPEHDQLTGENVIQCVGALSKINEAVLQSAAQQWQNTLSAFPSPRVAVLIGGNSAVYQLDRKTAGRIAQQLKELQKNYAASLWITVSRRTGEDEKNILRQSLQGENILFWDGAGDNPYTAFLASADFILVTEDSVSMHSEAAATGKPIYTIPLPDKILPSLFGRGQTSRRFHKDIHARGIARIFDGTLNYFQYQPLDEAKRISGLVRQKLGMRHLSAEALAKADEA